MKFKAFFAAAGVFASLALAAATAQAATISGLVSTGAGLTGGQSDPNWVVSGPSVTTGSAVVLSAGNSYGSWAPDDVNSSWIGACDCYYTPKTPYTFTQSFNLTGYTLSSVVISGAWGIDDTGTLSVNGNVIDSQSDTFSGVTFNVPTADLLAGLNTISMTMTSDDGVLDGARLLYYTASGTVSGVPEPAAWALMLVGVGMVGAGLRAQRRQRAQATAG